MHFAESNQILQIITSPGNFQQPQHIKIRQDQHLPMAKQAPLPY